MNKFRKTGTFFGSILVVYLLLLSYFTAVKDTDSFLMLGILGIFFAIIGVIGSVVWFCLFIERCFNQKSITFQSVWLPTLLCGFNVVVLILFAFSSMIF